MKNTSSYLNILLSVAILLLCIKLVSLSAPTKATAQVPSTPASTTAITATVDTAAATVQEAVTTDIATAEPQDIPANAPSTQPVATVPQTVKTDQKTEKKRKVEKAEKKEEPKAPTVRIINTTDIGKNIIGYAGPTPVEITIEDGKVKSIKALPNQESPGFLRRVLESGLLEKWNGKTIEEAKAMEVDGVTGATFTSTALIKNVKKGLSQK